MGLPDQIYPTAVGVATMLSPSEQFDGALDDCLVVIPLRSSSMDQHRDLAMREYLDRLAAEDECGNAAAAVRGHDN
jgi:hypothetical protein